MTAGESKAIGILVGTVDGLKDRLGKIEKSLCKLDEKLDAMQLHVAPAAARLAEELAAYKVEEAKYKVDVIGPMREEVAHLSARLSDEQVVKLDRAERHNETSVFRRWLIPVLVSIVVIVFQITWALLPHS